jgi:hypothetical protein
MTREEPNMTFETLSLGYDNNIVIDWIKKLDLFSFYKSGLVGHLADTDSFIVDVKYLDKDDLLNILRLLGLRFQLTNVITPKLLEGLPYSNQDLKTPQNSTEEFHDIECNSKNHIKDVTCAISIPKGYIHISIHRLPHEKDYYILTENEFEKAFRIEQIIKNSGLANRVTKEYQKYKGYVDKNKLDLIIK